MNTLRIENRVHDYDGWKQAFDKFDALRRDKGVRAYRITRETDYPLHVFIDLDFESATRAEDFRETLTRIWRTPQSRQHLADHVEPLVLDVLAGDPLPEPASTRRTRSAAALRTHTRTAVRLIAPRRTGPGRQRSQASRG